MPQVVVAQGERHKEVKGEIGRSGQQTLQCAAARHRFLAGRVAYATWHQQLCNRFSQTPCPATTASPHRKSSTARVSVSYPHADWNPAPSHSPLASHHQQNSHRQHVPFYLGERIFFSPVFWAGQCLCQSGSVLFHSPYPSAVISATFIIVLHVDVLATTLFCLRPLLQKPLLLRNQSLHLFSKSTTNIPLSLAILLELLDALLHDISPPSPA